MTDSLDRDTVLFLIRAKKATYAGKGPETASSRPGSHDLEYAEGPLVYRDTYLGGEAFAGQEALWRDGVPVYAMNYAGRVTASPFSGDFLKAALLLVPEEMPFRGPERFVQGDYEYRCTVTGDMTVFTGRETILYRGKEIYDCDFHGGAVR